MVQGRPTVEAIRTPVGMAVFLQRHVPGMECYSSIAGKIAENPVVGDLLGLVHGITLNDVGERGPACERGANAVGASATSPERP
ncbi:MAG TPA: hypothetical protein VHW23_07715 [Kofleriaceae bacterium]|jgi:hypothetical protein|nr:hypothetical protein [Kofleriaceae bacterium]